MSICRELGKLENLITHVGDRQGYNMRYAIDPTSIHNEQGGLPETKFAEGIKKTIQWYFNNREWWKTVISEHQNYYAKITVAAKTLGGGRMMIFSHALAVSWDTA